jgi:DNA helicase-2/ATP-dependent DNA helicase PcrA
MVEEMRQLVRDGLARQEIAVLYRSNAQSRVIETALFNAGVPYRVYGGLRFFERAEIKHALAYLRLLENPGDDTSFLRVVNFPPRGIGARSLEQLQDAARAAGCSLHDAVGCHHRQGRRQPGRLRGEDRCAARADPGPVAARDHRTGAASTAG